MSEVYRNIKRIIVTGLIASTTGGCDGRPLITDPSCKEFGIEELSRGHVTITAKYNPNKIAVHGEVKQAVYGRDNTQIGFLVLVDKNGHKISASIDASSDRPQPGDNYWVCGEISVSQTNGQTNINIKDQNLSSIGGSNLRR